MALGVILFFCNIVKAQDNQHYQEFEGFKKLGFSASVLSNRKTVFDNFDRSYSLKPNNSISYSFGFDYVFNPTKEYTFRTGLFITSIPLFNFEVSIPQENNPANFNNDFQENIKSGSNLVFSIPVFYELKKQLDKKVFFSAIAGLNFAILFDGEISTSIVLTDTDNDNSFEVFGSYALSNDFPIYPNLVLRPGLYFTGKNIIFHASFIYHKAIVPYFEGEYQFGNLVDAEPIRDNLKITGDYIGLGLTVYLKKRRPNR
jgi:hypothetical protein